MNKILVLLSTYNGENYLIDQVNSIMNQKNVICDLFIRDDGSSDGTINVIQKLVKEYPDRIIYEQGTNIGYARSFLWLVNNVSGYDYYSFADQDDVWKLDKSIKGIAHLRKDVPFLYASNLTSTDENLTPIKDYNFKNINQNIMTEFCRHRVPGCTYIFNEKLRKLVCKYPYLSLKDIPSHDVLIAEIAYACGTVFIDEYSSVLHRRLNTSVTSGGNGIIQRLKIEKKMVFGKPNQEKKIAQFIEKELSNNIKKDCKLFISLVAHYDESNELKRQLLSQNGFKTGIKICDLETKIRIIMNKY